MIKSTVLRKCGDKAEQKRRAYVQVRLHRRMNANAIEMRESIICDTTMFERGEQRREMERTTAVDVADV